MRPTTKKLLALSAAVSLGLAACGTDEVAQPAVSGEASPVEQDTTADLADDGEETEEEARADDPAATLRAELTALLQEHVYLAGMAIHAVLGEGEDDESAQAAIDALDDNSVAISELIADIPDVDDAEEFLDLWRDHIGYFVDYANGVAEGDDSAVDDALAGLEEYQGSAADLLEAVTDGEVASDEAFAELDEHVTMVTEAIDAMIEDDPEALELLRDAARHMDGVASDLAGAIVAAHPDEIDGDADSQPAQTRAQLTSSLQEHTYLMLFAVERAVDAGSTTDPAVQSAIELVEGNAERLANLIGAASGTDARAAFLQPWRDLAGAILDGVSAEIDGDTAAADEAESERELFRNALVALFDQVMGEGAATGDLGSDIDTYLGTIDAAIDAFIAEEPTAYDDARAAASHATDMAARLAAGITTASPDDDPADRLPDDPADVDPDGAVRGDTDAGTVGDPGLDEGAGTVETGPGNVPDPEPAEDPSENPLPGAEGGR